MTNTYVLQRSTPEEQGIPSSAITNFIRAAEQANLELHSLMLVRHGYVVAEGCWAPYSADVPHVLFSLSKSFTSTAIGFAIQEGILSVDDTVVSFFPELAELYHSNENLLRMRVRHLLSMSTGHAEDTMGRIGDNEDWVKSFLRLHVEHEPGTHFVYNSGASYMLSAILQRVTGETLFDYLLPRLFVPLNIENATWDTCPKGMTAGGWGLRVRTEDIAKFGQLYLQKGLWDGKRLLPADWVLQATSVQISNGNDGLSDWQQGYGYQFWRCRHGAYRGDGAFGQYCIVMPQQQAVFAIRSAVDDMQAVLNIVWEHILPAMSDSTLPHNEGDNRKLNDVLKKLEIKPPKYEPSSPIAGKVTGRRYDLKSEDNNEAISLTFTFDEQSTDVLLQNSQGEFPIKCGKSEWIEGITQIYGFPAPICASGMWSNENTFIMTLRFVDSPFYETKLCKFESDRLRVETTLNVWFGPKERPALEGNCA